MSDVPWSVVIVAAGLLVQAAAVIAILLILRDVYRRGTVR